MFLYDMPIGTHVIVDDTAVYEIVNKSAKFIKLKKISGPHQCINEWYPLTEWMFCNAHRYKIHKSVTKYIKKEWRYK